MSQTAAKLVKALNVDIKYNTKITNSSKTEDGGDEITLSNGEKLTADLYIPTFGMIPNSSYLDSKYINSKGFVVVDNCLRVKGTQNVWAIGDVSDHEPPQLMFADGQSTHLTKNILLVLKKATPLPHKISSPGMGLQIGRNNATGHFGNFKVPGFLISYLRKDLFLEMLPKVIDGSKF